MGIRTYKITVTTTGSAGAATGTGQTSRPVNGCLKAIHLDYTDLPNTSDVTITTAGAPVQTLLTKANANTDAWFYPRALLDDTAGADLTAIYDEMPIDDYVNVSVAQADAGSLVVTLLVEE